MSIEKRGNAWRARYRGPNGQQPNRSFRRKTDAERWLTTQKALMGRGDWVDPQACRILFADVADVWVGTLIRVKPKTAHQYKHLLHRWILPTWGRTPLGRITAEGIERWVADMTAVGLGHSGARQALVVLSSVLDASVRAHRIGSNPARLVRVRRGKPAERVVLTHREVDALARASDGSGDFVRFLAYTGLRVGEATALRVRDIDLERRRINIVRTFSDVGGQLVDESPKNHQHRSVPIVALLVPDLRARVQDKQRDDLVFTTERGSVMRLSNWRRRFNAARDAAGLDSRLTPHGLRHTAASLFIQAGTPPKVLQMILGHASITMMLDLYGHLYPDEMDRWATRLSEWAVSNMCPDDSDDSEDGQASTPEDVR